MNEPQFANILLCGPCNRNCPDCIGQKLPLPERRTTLDMFPLPGLDRLVERLSREGITQVSLTGMDTEPMLYHHQARLLEYLRARVAGVQVSLHTNGTLVLSHPDLFNSYDRATISVPSLDPETCLAMTGSFEVLDLGRILSASRIPIKISTLLSERNVREIPSLVEHCRGLGIRRMVLRKLFGGTSPAAPVEDWKWTREFAGNPVYDANGMEVTVWDFNRARLRCLNLFPDGRLIDSYLLRPDGMPKTEEIEFRALPPGIETSPSVGIFLGSFDPPHRGHLWIVQELLDHFDKVLLLIPMTHFHKELVPPRNATIEQRLQMLEEVRKLAPERIGIGTTKEVLFIRLDQKLQGLFPGARIGFGMGDETWDRVCSSEAYFRQSGFSWTEDEAAALESLRARVHLFERTRHAAHGIPVPEDTRKISSTAVRAAAAACDRRGLDLDGWGRSLERLVPETIARQIREKGLYRGQGR